MDAARRRKTITHILEEAKAPVSAASLAKEFSVSRQIIVGDVALLRAGGLDIAATPRGYVVPRGGGGAGAHRGLRPPGGSHGQGAGNYGGPGLSGAGRGGGAPGVRTAHRPAAAWPPGTMCRSLSAWSAGATPGPCLILPGESTFTPCAVPTRTATAGCWPIWRGRASSTAARSKLRVDK